MNRDRTGNERSLTWEPAYGTVAGLLPLAELARFQPIREGPFCSVVRTQLDATAATRVRLKLGRAQGLTVWLDGETVPVKENVELTLSAGLHVLTVAVNHGERTEALRLEVEDTPAAAGVRFVAGK